MAQKALAPLRSLSLVEFHPRFASSTQQLYLRNLATVTPGMDISKKGSNDCKISYIPQFYCKVVDDQAKCWGFNRYFKKCPGEPRIEITSVPVDLTLIEQ